LFRAGYVILDLLLSAGDGAAAIGGYGVEEEFLALSQVFFCSLLVFFRLLQLIYFLQRGEDVVTEASQGVALGNYVRDGKGNIFVLGFRKLDSENSNGL
jgi:hypothetical protein